MVGRAEEERRLKVTIRQGVAPRPEPALRRRRSHEAKRFHCLEPVLFCWPFSATTSRTEEGRYRDGRVTDIGSFVFQRETLARLYGKPLNFFVSSASLPRLGGSIEGQRPPVAPGQVSGFDQWFLASGRSNEGMELRVAANPLHIKPLTFPPKRYGTCWLHSTSVRCGEAKTA